MARLGLGLGKARREPQGGQNEELLEYFLRKIRKSQKSKKR